MKSKKLVFLSLFILSLLGTAKEVSAQSLDNTKRYFSAKQNLCWNQGSMCRAPEMSFRATARIEPTAEGSTLTLSNGINVAVARIRSNSIIPFGSALGVPEVHYYVMVQVVKAPQAIGSAPLDASFVYLFDKIVSTREIVLKKEYLSGTLHETLDLNNSIILNSK